MPNANDRVRKATIAAIGTREVTVDEVLNTARRVALVCGYVFGHDMPLALIVAMIVDHNIPDQIIE